MVDCWLAGWWVMVPDRESLAWVTQTSMIAPVPFWMNYEQNGHQFHFGWTMNRMAISSILDELWTEWSSVSFWMYYDQNGHQFLFGLTMNRMPISSILDELWSECPSVPFWMNYDQNGQNGHQASVIAPDPFWMNGGQNNHQFQFGWIMDRTNHQFHFGWTIDRMVIN